MFGKKKETPQVKEETKKTYEDRIKLKNSNSSNIDNINSSSTTNYVTEPNYQIYDNASENNKIDNMSKNKPKIIKKINKGVNINMSDSVNNVYGNEEATTNKKSFAFLNKNKKSSDEGI